MQEIYIEELGKIIQNKNKLEESLDIKITNKGKNIFVDGSPENEFIALEILEALSCGFTLDCALQLKNEENLLQILNIKDITKRRDLETVKGRIIGTQGKTLRTIYNLTDCNIAVKENKVGIIGHAEDIEDAIQSIESLIHGSKQGNVYARLEKQKKKKRMDKKMVISENKLKEKP
ncbi:MAG: KH domain-containing protein [Candidatus Pacearchaeota archaeon]